jgi:hypothetical protein
MLHHHLQLLDNSKNPAATPRRRLVETRATAMFNRGVGRDQTQPRRVCGNGDGALQGAHTALRSAADEALSSRRACFSMAAASLASIADSWPCGSSGDVCSYVRRYSRTCGHVMYFTVSQIQQAPLHQGLMHQMDRPRSILASSTNAHLIAPSESRTGAKTLAHVKGDSRSLNCARRTFFNSASV